MSRITKTVLIPENLLSFLKQELVVNANLIVSAKEDITKEHLLFIRSITTIVDMVDPRFNGGDYSIGNKWHSIEGSPDPLEVQFQNYINLLESLLEFRRCTVADLGQREEPHNNPIKTSYTVVPVPSDILSVISKHLDELAFVRGNVISEKEFLNIKRFSVLIDSLEERFYGKNLSGLEQGLSVAERWYSATCDDKRFSISENMYESSYEKMFAILYAIVRYKHVKVIYSASGLRCYSNDIYDEYIM